MKEYTTEMHVIIKNLSSNYSNFFYCNLNFRDRAKKELHRIASNDENIFSTEDFDHLADLLTNVSESTCDAAGKVGLLYTRFFFRGHLIFAVFAVGHLPAKIA